MDKSKKMEIPFSDDMRLEVYENGILEIVHNIDGKMYSATLHNKAFLSKLRSALKVKRGEIEDVFVELKKMMGVPKDLYTPSNEMIAKYPKESDQLFSGIKGLNKAYSKLKNILE